MKFWRLINTKADIKLVITLATLVLSITKNSGGRAGREWQVQTSLITSRVNMKVNVSAITLQAHYHHGFSYIIV